MENEEIARAVSGAVTSVLSKIAEQKEASSSRGASDSGDDFQPPRVKKRKQEKGKYVKVFMEVSALYVCN